jgi:quinol monooxygenase YgiN
MLAKKELGMAQKIFVLIVALTILATWSGKSAAQPPTTGHVLRVLTTTVMPDKRDQLPKVVAEITQVLATTKGIQWFKVGLDPATGEIVSVTLWNSQATVEAFLNSDARKTLTEKIRPLMQGEPSVKIYQVVDTKK